MQNGAIWGHFRVSYNIESSTILITDTLLSLSYAPDIRHDKTEILLKVALNTLNQNQTKLFVILFPLLVKIKVT
jgi:hypothetical protein